MIMNVIERLYAKWFIHRTLIETNPFLYWDYLQDADKKVWTGKLTIFGTKKEYQIEIEIDRMLACDIGFSIPKEFREQPLEVDKRRQNDKTEINFIKDFNAHNLRYISTTCLSYKKTFEITSHVANLQSASGKINIRLETKIGLGGQMLFCTLPIGLIDNEWNAKALDYRNRRFEKWKEANPEWNRNIY